MDNKRLFLQPVRVVYNIRLSCSGVALAAAGNVGERGRERRGEGTFRMPGVDSGKVESSLTSVSPYARLTLNERLSAWGLLGYGTGDMTMTQAARGDRKETVTRIDISMRMGAVGARGALMQADESGGLDLALRGDAFLVRTESAKAANTVATTADASRLRLVLEGWRTFAVGEATLTPTLELGLRRDGGDAETGTGVEIGGRIAYAGPVVRPHGRGERADADRARGRRLRGMGRGRIGAAQPRRLGPGPLAHAGAGLGGGVERGRAGCGRRATRRVWRRAATSSRSAGWRPSSATASGPSASAAWRPPMRGSASRRPGAGPGARARAGRFSRRSP